MELVTLPSGARVLNDAYNANPTSMAAALRSLAALDARRRIAVLGVMAELGLSSDAAHRSIGDLARELGIEVVAVAAPAYGGIPVAGLAEAVVALGELGDGDAVLLKGSRVAGLERLVDRLR
jgi:UDP-N-acetylmuramoyl-tripeptide--D-alanyl-D-alanine ligase